MQIRIQHILLSTVYLEFKLEIQKEKSNNYRICHRLFHTTVLQYTQSRIHRPKMRNNIFIYLLFHFLLDPEY